MTTLVIQYTSPSIPPQILEAISRQHSITSLKFNLRDRHVDKEVEFLRSMSPLASRLVSLDFDVSYDPRFAELDILRQEVERFLRRCTSLKQFTGSSFHNEFLDDLISPLESWNCTSASHIFFASTSRILNSTSVAMQSLKCLRLHVDHSEWAEITVFDQVVETRKWERWSEVNEICREKKIKLTVRMDDESDDEGESIATPPRVPR